MSPGLFITIEGGEGVGKTTLISGLRHYFSDTGVPVLFTREPGGSARAEALRNVLLSEFDAENDMTVETEALIISAARSDHVAHTVLPALKEGRHVVCDRFADSTRAYQGHAIDSQKLETIIEFSTHGLRPDITLLLDGDPEKLLTRRVARDGTKDRFEVRGLAFHDAVRKRFLKVADQFPSRISIINAEESPSEVLKSAIAFIEKKLAMHKSTAVLN